MTSSFHILHHQSTILRQSLTVSWRPTGLRRRGYHIFQTIGSLMCDVGLNAPQAAFYPQEDFWYIPDPTIKSIKKI
jgi:hypothetical protein